MIPLKQNMNDTEANKVGISKQKALRSINYTSIFFSTNVSIWTSGSDLKTSLSLRARHPPPGNCNCAMGCNGS